MMLLSLRRIARRFGAVAALTDVNLDVAAGEVHALLGENGAGKSTLMHIAYGMLQPDTGTIVLGDGAGHDTTANFTSPHDARRAGIGMVHQHFTSIAAFSVAENIALAAGWPEVGRAAERRAATVVEAAGLPLPVTAIAGTLSVQLRQRLEIVKALAGEARILLLDEPTAVLAPREVATLLGFLRDFAARGNAVVLITHKLEEAVHVADRVTVLRRGNVTLSAPIGRESVRSLAHAMIGSDLLRHERHTSTPGKTLIRADHLMLARLGAERDHGASPAIVDATFTLRGGEIVGVAAIDGNGQRELLRALAGVDSVRRLTGTLDVSGPIALVPEDRINEAIIGSFSLTENLVFATLRRRPPWIRWRAARAETAKMIGDYDIRTTGADAQMSSLSGGNQQKFVLGRSLSGAPQVIIAEDPTRGLDLQATEAIHSQLRDAARAGALVVVHSSDLDEVLGISDRLLVVARGTVRELSPSSPRDVIGDAMLGLAESS